MNANTPVVKSDQNNSVKSATEGAIESSLKYKPQISTHWKRWYFVELRTRDRFWRRVRLFFILVYPVWVVTHLNFYKPDEERVRKAYLDYELRSLHSPYARLKALQEEVERKSN